MVVEDIACAQTIKTSVLPCTLETQGSGGKQDDCPVSHRQHDHHRKLYLGFERDGEAGVKDSRKKGLGDKIRNFFDDMIVMEAPCTLHHTTPLTLDLKKTENSPALGRTARVSPNRPR